VPLRQALVNEKPGACASLPRPRRTTSGPATPPCPGDPWGPVRPLRFLHAASPRRDLAAVGSPRASAAAVAQLESSTLVNRGRSRPARSLIDANHLQHEDNDDDCADQVNDRAHVKSLLSEWLAAIRGLMVPCGSGRVVPRLSGSCRVPSPGLIPAALRPPVLSGVCKGRSSPLAGWADDLSVLLNRVVGCDAVLNLREGTDEKTHEILEPLRNLGRFLPVSPPRFCRSNLIQARG
jgi:hypothetical protein